MVRDGEDGHRLQKTNLVKKKFRLDFPRCPFNYSDSPLRDLVIRLFGTSTTILDRGY